MKRENDDYLISETGNWNVASEYSKLKIMKLLYEADIYSNIAKFGTSTLFEEFENPYPDELLKIKGFERLINTLIMLIDNSLFAIKFDKDKKLLNGWKEDLEKVEKLMPLVSKTITNQLKKTKSIKIDKDKYDRLLKYVTKIKAEINRPLNSSDLIYVHREEFDPKKYKEEIMKNAINRG